MQADAPDPLVAGERAGDRGDPLPVHRPGRVNAHGDADHPPPPPWRERAAREARRLRAAELFTQGRTQAEVARELGVSRQSVHIWHTRFAQGGVEALRSRGPTGPDPKLSAVQLAKVERALLAGAMANGFDTDLWTLERVAVVIT